MLCTCYFRRDNTSIKSIAFHSLRSASPLTRLALEIVLMSQKALFLSSSPDSEWKVGTREIPKPVAGDVLVKVQAAALNPIDWKVRTDEYNFVIKKWPAVLGSDAAGTVEEMGDGVTKFEKGDKV